MGGNAGSVSPSNLADCKNGDLGPCGTFTTQTGVKIALGSYGAVMEQNVGKGFEVRLASGDSDGGASCSRVVASFGEDPEGNKSLLDTAGIDFALYTSTPSGCSDLSRLQIRGRRLRCGARRVREERGQSVLHGRAPASMG